MTSPNKSPQELDAWLALTGQIAPPDHSVRLPMLSGSMAPDLPTGTWLHIAVAQNPPCQPGQVVVFCEEQQLTAHRVLLVLRLGRWNWLLEKGDANRYGRWRRGQSVCGTVRSYTTVTENVATDPSDPARASQELRRLIIHYLKRLVRPGRPSRPDEETD